MCARRTGLELGMELAPDEPGVLRIFDDLDELSIGTHTAESESVLDELVAIAIRHLVPVPVPLADFRGAVNFRGLRSAREARRIRAEPHGAAHVGDMLLRF